MPPIPCSHCGTLFMRRDLRDGAPKVCNSCENKELRRNSKGDPKMTDVNHFMRVSIELPHALYSKIEEICTSKGISFSEYFKRLHEVDTESVESSINYRLSKGAVDAINDQFKEKPTINKSKLKKSQKH